MTELAYTILLVQDLEAAKAFYTRHFGQIVDVDMGKLIGFKSGLALWEQGDMAAQAGLESASPLIKGRGGMELEFHSEDIDALFNCLLAAGVQMVHEVRTHPWGQKVFRCLDPDGHCIEVDEYLRITARRLYEEGRSAAEIADVFGIDREAVEVMLG